MCRLRSGFLPAIAELRAAALTILNFLNPGERECRRCDHDPGASEPSSGSGLALLHRRHEGRCHLEAEVQRHNRFAQESSGLGWNAQGTR